MDMVDDPIGFHFSCRDFTLHCHRASCIFGGKTYTKTDCSALVISCCAWQVGHQSL